MYKNAIENKSLISYIDLSTLCNAKCPQCHRTNVDGLDKVDWLPDIQWTFEEFKKAFPIQTLKLFQEFQICGTWGDPITNKDISKVVEYIIKNTKAKILINTNGSLRSKKWCYNFGSIGLKRLKVFFAIEGIDQEMHSTYRINTDLKKVLNNIEGFRMGGGEVGVYVVVFEHNEDYLEEIQQLATLYGSVDTIFHPSNRFGPYNEFRFKHENKIKELKPITNKDNKFFQHTESYIWDRQKHTKRRKDYDQSSM